MKTFDGFPPELFTFFEGLQDDNSRDYWNVNKTTWQEQVRKPMLTLLDELAAEFGPMRMFRPNRDVRFAKDKSPYKLVGGRNQRVPSDGWHRVLPGGVYRGHGDGLWSDGDGWRSTPAVSSRNRRGDK